MRVTISWKGNCGAPVGIAMLIFRSNDIRMVTSACSEVQATRSSAGKNERLSIRGLFLSLVQRSANTPTRVRAARGPGTPGPVFRPGSTAQANQNDARQHHAQPEHLGTGKLLVKKEAGPQQGPDVSDGNHGEQH